MTKTRVETIRMLPFGMLNAFLLITGRNAVLVDTGLPNSEKLVERALSRNGLDWSSLRLIVLTHAHIDHAGSADRLRELTSAPIMAHEGDIPYLKGASPILQPTGPFGRLFRMTGAIERPFRYLAPDLTLSTEISDLSEFGVPAHVLHTPGHTPGSISVRLAGGKVIAGDLAASGILLGGIALTDRPKAPPFEESPVEVAASLKRLLADGCKQFYLGHGGPLDALQIGKHIRSMDTLAASLASGR